MRYPRACYFCERSADGVLCDECRRRFAKECSPKVEALSMSEGALTLFRYEGECTQKLLFDLKGAASRAVVNLFADEMAAHLSLLGAEFSCITHVPRRRSQKRKIGVDQAKLLAKALSRRVGIAHDTLLARRGFSRRQHGLTPIQREENVRGKFALRRMHAGNILLLDDVLTTGATCREACRTLLSGGARAVYVVAPIRGGRI